MKFPLFDAPPREASATITFAGNVLDRQSDHRSETCVADALRDPAARILLIDGSRLLARTDNGQVAGSFLPLAQAAALGLALDDTILLGQSPEGPVLAARTVLDPGALLERLPAGLTVIDHRAVYVQGDLDPAEAGAVAQGAALLAWHASHRFCGRCGQMSEMRAGGARRVCPACGTEHFPRTDPVAIMLTVTPGKCLLGRGQTFPPGRYSALAGFIEPGETIEDAVRRETFEESGIRLGRVVYHASQPWPFPYSLMIGCFGEAVSDIIDADLTELADCRWFGRDEVRLMLENVHPEGIGLPPGGAIARHLVEAWVAAG